jgi:hypothetical protein
MVTFCQQRGAMFGLDARLSLIIFTVLTLVSGYTGLKAYSQIKAQSFVSDLRNFSKATAQMERDLQHKISTAISPCGPINCSYINSFLSLTSQDYINSNYISRWHGPYITRGDSINAKYGAGRIYQYDASYAACTAGSPCYSWVYLPAVKASSTVIELANSAFDGGGEGSPATSGVFRYTDNGNGTYIVNFRMGRTIN